MPETNPSSPVGAERVLDAPFDEVVNRTTAALKDEGFGVLCDIDVQATLKEKIGVDREAYRILGACNPPLADQALQEAPELGVLLPCNVVVRQEQGRVRVSAVDPGNLLGLLPPSKTLEEIAQDVDKRLHRALESI